MTNIRYEDNQGDHFARHISFPLWKYLWFGGLLKKMKSKKKITNVTEDKNTKALTMKLRYSLTHQCQIKYAAGTVVSLASTVVMSLSNIQAKRSFLNPSNPFQPPKLCQDPAQWLDSKVLLVAKQNQIEQGLIRFPPDFKPGPKHSRCENSSSGIQSYFRRLSVSTLLQLATVEPKSSSGRNWNSGRCKRIQTANFLIS